MCIRHTDSERTKIRTNSYLAGYQECTGPLASSPLGQFAYRFTHRLLGDHPVGWKFGVVMNAYRRGWRDKAQGKPCQPWPHSEIEGHA